MLGDLTPPIHSEAAGIDRALGVSGSGVAFWNQPWRADDPIQAQPDSDPSGWESDWEDEAEVDQEELEPEEDPEDRDDDPEPHGSEWFPATGRPAWRQAPGTATSPLRQHDDEDSHRRASHERSLLSALSELQALRSRLSEESRSHRELLQYYENREEELEQQLQAASAELEESRSELASLRRRAREQRQSQERLVLEHRDQLRELQEDLLSARQEVSNAKATVESLRQRSAGLRQDREQLERESQARLSALQQELATTRQQLSERGEELEVLQELREQRQAWLAREQQWQEELETARREAAAARQQATGRADDGAEHALPGEMERLEQELASLQQLLEELPDIYERKFRQRLQPLQEQRDWLLRENAQLQAHWQRLMMEEVQADSSEAEPAAAASPRQDPDRSTPGGVQRRPPALLPAVSRLRQGLRSLFRLGRQRPPGIVSLRDSTPPDPSDDGQPTDA